MNKSMVFEEDGIEYMKLCLNLTVYWTGSVFDHVAGITNFYRNALGLIKNELKYYATEKTGKPKPVTKEVLELLPKWLSRRDKSRDILTLSLESGSEPGVPSDNALEFWAVEYPKNPAGLIRLILPIDWIKKSSQDFINLTRSLVGDMKFHSGYGGYAVNWYKGPFGFAAQKEMSILSRRYPGIELPEAATTLMAIPSGIKRVNWLTLLGTEVVKSAKELETITKKLITEGIQVEPLSQGVLIIASEEPRIGDVNRQKKDLNPYHKVGVILTGLRSKDHPPFLLNRDTDPDEEITEDWLSYFDK